jgi:hypothetical protein
LQVERFHGFAVMLEDRGSGLGFLGREDAAGHGVAAPNDRVVRPDEQDLPGLVPPSGRADLVDTAKMPEFARRIGFLSNESRASPRVWGPKAYDMDA